jgi:hypothetical protein
MNKSHTEHTGSVQVQHSPPPAFLPAVIHFDANFVQSLDGFIIRQTTHPDKNELGMVKDLTSLSPPSPIWISLDGWPGNLPSPAGPVPFSIFYTRSEYPGICSNPLPLRGGGVPVNSPWSAICEGSKHSFRLPVGMRKFQPFAKCPLAGHLAKGAESRRGH